MRMLENRGFLTGFATLVLFSGLAADAWRNSISWYGYGAVVALITALSVAILVRRRMRWRELPWPLAAFLALATVSIAWSAYPLESVIGVVAQFVTTIAALAIALVVTGAELLRALGRALRIILSLSLLFELVVALIVRQPVLPVWVTGEDRVDPPLLLFWSRNLLLEGDRIQGIVGSSSLLAMVALLALVVFAVQLAAGTVRRAPGILWLALAVAMIGLTRSATIYLGIVAVVVVLGMILAVRRASTPRARLLTYGGVAVAGAAMLAAGLLLRGQFLEAVGKSADLTGRIDIWDAVIGLAQERPVFGWGWISFWAPWVEPFADLITRNGVVQLHAHNAWLDVWLQLGVVGLVVFGALVAVTGLRAWLLATEPPVGVPGADRFSSLALLPALLLTALLVQSLAESRILVEGGWLLLVILAVTTKLERTRGRSRRPLPSAARRER